MPSKYTKLEENFGGFIKRSLIRFEFEKSLLHTIVFGGTGTRKTYFIRQYYKLYLDQAKNQKHNRNQNQDQNQDYNQNQIQYKNQEQEQEQEQKRIIITCKDERDCIDPETGMLDLICVK